MTPEAGDFFVVATNGVVARLIRWFTGSWANHAGIYLGAGCIIEANPGGVRVAALNKYDGEPIAWSDMRLTDKELDRLLGACVVMEGIPYGFFDIAALVLRRWRVHIWSDARLARGDRLICSQLIVRAYRAAGRVIVPDVPDNYVTPGDLAELLTESR